jgi:hypothetical protein
MKALGAAGGKADCHKHILLKSIVIGRNPNSGIVVRRNHHFSSKIRLLPGLLVLGLLLMIAGMAPAAAQGFTGTFFAGTAWNLPMPLRVEQPGEPALHFKARYRTRPWKGAPYYAYRLGYEQWEAELVHHKLYLQNPPPEIQHFEVSHGYNLAMVNYARPSCGFVIRLGIGLLIAHPEGRIRGKAVGPVRSLLGGGYHISGISAQLSLAREFDLTPHLFTNPEIKFTAAWARVPLAGGGRIEIPNLALHALTGLGFRTKERQEK